MYFKTKHFFEKRAKELICCVSILGSFLFAAFAQTNQTSTNDIINTVEGPVNAKEYREATKAAMAEAQRAYDKKMQYPEMLTNPLPSEWPFPNYQTGPTRPLPDYQNFYCMDDRYPTYLLCQYDVNVKDYSESDEPKWFKTALKQIRKSGQKKFPPLEWIAVMIVNRAESKGPSSYEQCCKVAAIFKASDIFSNSKNIPQLVAEAQMDRHPFFFDKQKPTPGEQQRWMIVEKHAATNNIAAPPNSSK